MSFDSKVIDAKKDLAQIVDINKNGISVKVVADSCKSCAVSGICKLQDKVVTFKVPDISEYEKGDYVEILVKPSGRIFSAFMVFIFPLIFMIAFYLAANLIFHLSEGVSIIFSFVGLIIGGVILKLFDKKLGDKIEYEITKWSADNENSFK